MLQLFPTATLVAATLTTGMVAGLFYAFSCAVMPGLRRSDDHTFVTAMRSINIAILNGWFALGFVGALLLTSVAVVLQVIGERGTALPWMVVALALYVVTLVVTGRVSVPLNDRLALTPEAGPEADADLAAARASFERAWNRWNVVRTLTNLAAFTCLTVALLVS